MRRTAYGRIMCSIVLAVALAVLPGCNKYWVQGDLPSPKPRTVSLGQDRQFYIAYAVEYVPQTGVGDVNLSDMCQDNNPIVDRKFEVVGMAEFSCLRDSVKDEVQTSVFAFSFVKDKSGASCPPRQPVNSTFAVPFILYQNGLDCSLRVLFKNSSEVSADTQPISNLVGTVLSQVGSNANTVSKLGQVFVNGEINTLVARLNNVFSEDDGATGPNHVILGTSILPKLEYQLELWSNKKEWTPRKCGLLRFTEVVRLSRFTQSVSIDGKYPLYSMVTIPPVKGKDGTTLLDSYLKSRRDAVVSVTDADKFDEYLSRTKKYLVENYYLTDSDLAYALYFVARENPQFATRAFSYCEILAPSVELLVNCGVTEYPGTGCETVDLTGTDTVGVNKVADGFLDNLYTGHGDRTERLCRYSLSDRVYFMDLGGGLMPSCYDKYKVAEQLQRYSGRYAWYIITPGESPTLSALFADGKERLLVVELDVGRDMKIHGIALRNALEPDVESFKRHYQGREEEIAAWIQEHVK